MPKKEEDSEPQLDNLKMALRMMQFGIKDIRTNQDSSASVKKALALVESIGKSTEPSSDSEEPPEKKIKLENEEYVEDYEDIKPEITIPTPVPSNDCAEQSEDAEGEMEDLG